MIQTGVILNKFVRTDSYKSFICEFITVIFSCELGYIGCFSVYSNQMFLTLDLGLDNTGVCNTTIIVVNVIVVSSSNIVYCVFPIV